MTLKKTFSTLLLAAILCAPFSISAQVTIGSDRAPSPWSLLDLDNSERVRNNEQPLGLHLPRLDEEARYDLDAEAAGTPAQGLMIFNTDNECVEFWNGTQWVSLCKGDVLPTDIVLSCVNTLDVGNTITLTAKVVPDGAPQNVIWSSSDPSVATVNTLGQVTAVAPGTTTITAATANGRFPQTCEIRVVDINAIPFGTASLSGVTCFDIGYSSPGNNCGTVAGRAPHSHTFATDPTETYTFSVTGGITNLTFLFVNNNSVPVIQSISSTGTGTGATVTVTFNTALDTEARGRDRANALTAYLHAIFDDVSGNPHRVSIRLSVRDCVCCPGLFIPGGAFTEIGTIAWDTMPVAARTEVNSNDAAASISATTGMFLRSGRDLCIYYRDFSTTANPRTNTPGRISWNNATNSGNNMSHVCGSSDGRGVDGVHAHGDWRVPNIAELAQIGQLASINIAENQLTQAMVDARIGAPFPGTNGFLPAGSIIEHDRMYNMRSTPFRHWSSTREGTAGAWIWGYSQNFRHAGWNLVTSGSYVRCVRSF